MTDLIKINHVEPLEDYWVRIEFSDGAVKDVDLGELLARGGVFAEIRDDRRAFEQVRVATRSNGRAVSTSTPRCSTADASQRPAPGSPAAR